MALMEDERLVLRWLSQYGPLRLPQIWGLLHYKPQRSVNRLVQNMKRTRRIAAIEDGAYLAVDQYCEPKQRMITAVWVLLQFIEQIDPEAHWHHRVGVIPRTPETRMNTGFFARQNGS